MRSVPNWNRYFLDIAHAVSKRSKDPVAQVGCVITGPTLREIRVTGYNGFPVGVVETPERWASGIKHNRVVHAEANAIISAGRLGVSVHGCMLYTTLVPCVRCATIIAAAGIRAVVMDKESTRLYAEAGENSWLTEENLDIVRSIFREANIDFLPY